MKHAGNLPKNSAKVFHILRQELEARCFRSFTTTYCGMLPKLSWKAGTSHREEENEKTIKKHTIQPRSLTQTCLISLHALARSAHINWAAEVWYFVPFQLPTGNLAKTVKPRRGMIGLTSSVQAISSAPVLFPIFLDGEEEANVPSR